VVPRAGLDDVEKRKFLILPSNSDPSAVQPVTSHYTDCAVPVPCTKLIMLTNKFSDYADLTFSVCVSDVA
jgi:hypothetical protein